jgi:hypothetical protein
MYDAMTMTLLQIEACVLMARSPCDYAVILNTELLVLELQALSAHVGEGLRTTPIELSSHHLSHADNRR